MAFYRREMLVPLHAHLCFEEENAKEQLHSFRFDKNLYLADFSWENIVEIVTFAQKKPWVIMEEQIQQKTFHKTSITRYLTEELQSIIYIKVLIL